MSEHYYRVGVHGPPDPKRHPWVMVGSKMMPWQAGRVRPDGSVEFPPNVIVTLTERDEWFPIDAPPSELAPEPEDQGVEVRGYLYRQRWDGDVEVMRDGKWLRTGTPEMYRDYAEIAQALGLVDQPPVPKALVDWLTRCVERVAPTGVTFRKQEMCVELLDRIKAGEFGPVEPSVEWVTDRVPNDDEYPVLWGKDGHMRAAPRRDRDWYLANGWRWVSLSVLLDAAGLGER